MQESVWWQRNMATKDQQPIKYIYYDGVKFVRRENKYYQSQITPTSGERLLHRYKYEKEVGEIPHGHVVHHMDGNKENNNIKNLKAIPNEKHASLHGNINWQDEEYRKKHSNNTKEQWRDENFREIRRKVIQEQWKDKNFRAKQRNAVKKTTRKRWQNREYKTYRCEMCNKTFKSRAYIAPRFCSIDCRRPTYQESRICVICGKKFEVAKYSPTKTCSRTCASYLGRKGENK